MSDNIIQLSKPCTLCENRQNVQLFAGLIGAVIFSSTACTTERIVAVQPEPPVIVAKPAPPPGEPPKPAAPPKPAEPPKP